eukprot:TRINITY_DN6868_c0_g1_i3.p1 TRINITY_DN6868_c0_g1~~TRINITY_DN6868_c0_g1_i3.p1  ORF type:complete len:133 (+),score=3.47 TRINITY_DN6868_c0_g1_i3:470-868(+)
MDSIAGQITGLFTFCVSTRRVHSPSPRLVNPSCLSLNSATRDERKSLLGGLFRTRPSAQARSLTNPEYYLYKSRKRSYLSSRRKNTEEDNVNLSERTNAARAQAWVRTWEYCRVPEPLKLAKAVAFQDNLDT